MIGRFHGIVGSHHLAVGPDEDRDASRFFRIHLGRAIGDRCRLVLIAQKIVGEVELGAESAVVRGRVEADAQYNGITV